MSVNKIKTLIGICIALTVFYFINSISGKQYSVIITSKKMSKNYCACEKLKFSEKIKKLEVTLMLN